MILIGAHMPTTNGIDKVPQETVRIGGNAFQVFGHNPRTWRAQIPSQSKVKSFKEQMVKHKFLSSSAFCHSGYLMNLASPKDDMWEKSVQLLITEMRICLSLGIKFLNIHPGSHLNSGETQGISRIAKAIDLALEKVSEVILLLENVSPKGANIGYKFSQIKDILDNVSEPRRIGITYDTCHGFDAGYDITSVEGVRKLLDEIENNVGLEKLKMIHLNDSKAPLGKALDRHENIGRGFIGDKGFSVFLSFEEIQKIPWILETPGSNEEHAQDIRHVKEILGMM